VSCKKREPVYAQLGDEQGGNIENPKQRDQGCEPVAREGGNGHEHASDDENKSNGVAADDPLPVKFKISTADGEQCSRASDDPENGLDESREAIDGVAWVKPRKTAMGAAIAMLPRYIRPINR
jgi:hypothetical protein